MTGFCYIIEKIFPDDTEKQLQALQRLATFRNLTGKFSRHMVKSAAKQMSVCTWWFTFGG